MNTHIRVYEEVCICVSLLMSGSLCLYVCVCVVGKRERILGHPRGYQILLKHQKA